MGKQYEITENHTLDFAKLNVQWRHLESLCNPSFFLRWEWISTWIQCYQPKLLLLMVSHNGSLVAMGIFVKTRETISGGLPLYRWRLHQTGVAAQDQIWIEYNNILCAPGHEPEAQLACLKHLYTYHRSWDEIVLANMPDLQARNLLNACPHARSDSSITCYQVDLSSIKEECFLDTLSRNSRYQIRRSMRKFEVEFGLLSLEEADSVDTAIDWFHEGGDFHKQRWEDSGFWNDEFLTFHLSLLKSGYPRNKVNLLRLRAGILTVGILYFLVSDGVAYFYLQGLNRFDDPKLKPGLVSHCFAIEHFKQQGFHLYDFMGGESQYKRQLCNQTSNITTVVLKNTSWKMRFIDMARALRKRITRQT